MELSRLQYLKQGYKRTIKLSENEESIIESVLQRLKNIPLHE